MESVVKHPRPIDGPFRTVIVGVDEHQGGRDATALATELLARDGSLALARVYVRDSLIGQSSRPNEPVSSLPGHRTASGRS